MHLFANMITVALAFLCFAVPIMMGNRLGVIRYFSPLHILGGMAFLGVTVKVLYYQFEPSSAFYVPFVTDRFALLWGTIYISLFIFAVCLGYIIAYPHRRFVPSYIGETRFADLRRPWLLAPIGLLIAYLIVHTLFSSRGLSIFDPNSFIIVNSIKQFNLNSENIGSTGAIVKNLLAVPRLIFVLCVMRAVVSRKKVDYFAASLIFGALVIAAFSTGDRFDFLRLLVLCGVAAVFAGWTLRIRSLLILILMLFLSFASVGAMSSLRSQAENENFSISKGAVGAVEHLLGSTYFLDVNVSTILVSDMDSRHLMYGETYTWWTFGWIPRAFWPQKPATDVGSHLKRDILGYGSDAQGAINVTGPGEAFINFAWAGIFVGFLLGVLYRALEILTLYGGHRKRGTFVYYPVAVVPLILATMQSSFSAALVSFGMIMVLCFLAKSVFLLDRTRRLVYRKDRVKVSKIQHNFTN